MKMNEIKERLEIVLCDASYASLPSVIKEVKKARDVAEKTCNNLVVAEFDQVLRNLDLARISLQAIMDIQ